MTEPTNQADIGALRAFNRAYTRRLGLLNAHLDKSPFTLTEARILYEIANRTAPTAADIMRALGLDRGQLSRTLKRFTERGLIETEQHPDGGRSRPILLTEAGRKTFNALERNTCDTVGELLDGLQPDRRRDLLTAAGAIMRVFDEGQNGQVQLRDLKAGDLGWIIHRQAILYTGEYGWNNEYEALVARILADFTENFDPAHDAGWVAEIDGRVVGSVFLVKGGQPGLGKLRLLYVEPDARGAGVGAKLVNACIERARAVGDEHLTLWTNSVLTAARRLYERAGFKLVEEAPHHSFGVDLIGQIWELDLTASLQGQMKASA
ncbi:MULTISPECIES: bifunctional helix-turn-helix transcriptional regulator/GNAT family N-acetyltransferase [Brucella/Ochrobactrum group]|uniref:Acetyltransferase, GNAT family n=1 Tax=Ochrobactrum soli TaxID=2448455 RepID=A0A2P9HQQ9_9HYPH|nr:MULTISPECIES: helix-turn-helix domain-containing GNAT family N-acetyltransferase [Brucella]RRD24314.1 MarR family transcriptional regulator [Brucellaceae bacterium VT-16-1752]WHT41724.1 helix-turn-helix domain-containing GNAT family N-acetyltransferase [Ochrobactrum sp. SSR]MDX4073864.1 helix-turn-helix domain-containing GNAT family N-acetyltransferase [Brucella sp. NBRC 113783]WHS31799.1 helix-turn-helix domain-containing GNAT family N-acetyltransferase [Brucella sp. NM4]SPL66431.1 Acetylt